MLGRILMENTLRKAARIGSATILSFVFMNHCGPGTPTGEPPQNGFAESQQTKSSGNSSSSSSGSSTGANATTPSACRNACRKQFSAVASFRDEWDSCVKACDGEDGCSAECDGEYTYNCSDAPDECDAIDACFDKCK
jgi:hypothetical protein